MTELAWLPDGWDPSLVALIDSETLWRVFSCNISGLLRQKSKKLHKNGPAGITKGLVFKNEDINSEEETSTNTHPKEGNQHGVSSRGQRQWASRVLKWKRE